MVRLGYGHFADYYKRFGYKKEDIYYKCGQKRLKTHSFNYSSIKILRIKLFSIKDRRLLTPKEVLGIA